MIGNLSYDEFMNIASILEKSNSNLKNLLEYYKDDLKTGTARMERFTTELDNYVKYLNNTCTINKDADSALEKLKELNR